MIDRRLFHDLLVQVREAISAYISVDHLGSKRPPGGGAWYLASAFCCTSDKNTE